jgi:hypothetical protein
MLVADIAPVLADAVLPAPVVPDRQAAAIRAVIGACRRVLRWLALRGDPPGNRCLPDIVPSRGAAAANAAGRRGFNRKPRPHDQRFPPQESEKPAGRVPSPYDNSRRFKLAVPQRRCAPGERLRLSSSPEYLNRKSSCF